MAWSYERQLAVLRHLPLELGQLVEEEDAVVGEAHLPRRRDERKVCPRVVPRPPPRSAT
jgi:hypothetical protein